MKGPVIKVKNLSLELGANTILKDINLTVERGVIHCLVGPNGGGKTSLIKSILGQMPHSGDVHMEMEGDEAPTIGYVPQFLNFDSTLPVTVLDFMAISCQRRPAFLGLGKKIKKDVEMALDKVGFEGKRNRKLGSLSGGERQRVLFAQALIPEPQLLVLDEPMTSLDEGGIQQFENLVQECSHQGVTVLWINHDMKQVQRLAQSVSCINRTLVYHGLCADVLPKAGLEGRAIDSVSDKMNPSDREKSENGSS